MQDHIRHAKTHQLHHRNHSPYVTSISFIRPALGQSCKAVGHVGKLKTQRWGKISWELVVLRDNVAHCCIHGLKCCPDKLDMRLLRRSIYVSACVSVCQNNLKIQQSQNVLSIDLSIYLSIYLSVYICTCRTTYLSISLSIYPSVCLSIHLSIYLSVCLPIYLPNNLPK